MVLRSHPFDEQQGRAGHLRRQITLCNDAVIGRWIIQPRSKSRLSRIACLPVSQFVADHTSVALAPCHGHMRVAF
jgi:hypothetical protein